MAPSVPDAPDHVGTTHGCETAGGGPGDDDELERRRRLHDCWSPSWPIKACWPTRPTPSATSSSLLPGAQVVIAGAQPGIVAGPGGAHEVEATFDELDRADVVVVPGGLGAHRHPEIAAWLRRIKPRFVLASSTGSALLAASGLLQGPHCGDALARRPAARASRRQGLQGPARGRRALHHLLRAGQCVRRRVRRRRRPSAALRSCARSASSWPRRPAPPVDDDRVARRRRSGAPSELRHRQAWSRSNWSSASLGGEATGRA